MHMMTKQCMVDSLLTLSPIPLGMPLSPAALQQKHRVELFLNQDPDAMQDYEPPSGDLSAALEKQFGSLDQMIEKFNPAAAGIQVKASVVNTVPPASGGLLLCIVGVRLGTVLAMFPCSLNAALPDRIASVACLCHLQPMIHGHGLLSSWCKPTNCHEW